MPQDLTPPLPGDAGANAADAVTANLLNQQLGAVIESLGTANADTVAQLMDIATAITSSIVGGTTGVTANRLLRSKGISGFALQNSPVTLDDSANFSGAANITFLTGSGLRTGVANADTLLLQAYDVDGAAYVTFGTLTAGNTPTFNLSTSTTIGGIGFATLNTNTWLQQQGFGRVSLTDASTITWNAQTQQSAYVLLTSGIGATRALGAPSNLVSGFTYILVVQQSSTGSNALTYNSVYKWPGGVAPVLSTANNAIDILTFISDGTNMYGVAQKAFA